MTARRKEKERAHIEKIGTKAFNRALGIATQVVRGDNRLIGMERLRDAIIDDAALIGTGYPRRAFMLPRGAGEPTQNAQTVCEEIRETAINTVFADFDFQ